MRMARARLQAAFQCFMYSVVLLPALFLTRVHRVEGRRRGTGAADEECKSCFCNDVSRIVYCSGKGLSSIPNDIPANTLQLNVNGNNFQTPSIHRSNFSLFLDLEHLYLSECGIESIDVDTFHDLVHLKWLDLSGNRIKIIQDNTFRGLNLQQLFLNGNRDLKLTAGSFSGLITNGLYLHECSLKTLEVQVLAPLNNTLQYLWLNGNEMERIDKGFSTIFETLLHLRLGANPLHCNCEVGWLKQFFDRKQSIFEGSISPSCLTPAKLRGLFFQELDAAELRCQSPVFNNIDALFGTDQGKLKCSASGDPAPTLYWIQPNGKTSKYTPTGTEEVKKTDAILNITGDLVNRDHWSGMYICVANNEAGNVTLTINVSWPHTLIPMNPYTVSPSSVSTPPPTTQLPPSPTTISTPGTQEFSTTPPKQIPAQRDQRRTNSNNNSYTAINMLDFHVRRGERLFNLTELIGAVIGTHVCTLLLCLILMPIYYRRKLRQHHIDSLDKKKPPCPEKLYLNGSGHYPVDYMDTPSSSPKR